MPTIDDVAKAAGVSTATVSRALTGSASVAAPTRSHILAVVEQLGYVPNVAAKALRTTRTSKILVAVPNIANAFFGRVLRGIEQAAHDAGYAMLLGDTRGEESREAAFGAMLHRKEADGVIFLGHVLPDTLRQVVEERGAAAPVVNACGIAEPGVASVVIDNQAAGFEAGVRVYGLGHREVAFIAGQVRSQVSAQRFQGLQRAARDAGAEGGLSMMRAQMSHESGFDTTLALLQSRPEVTAIVCVGDEVALGALAAVRQTGRRCPEDISVMGFDDLAFSPLLYPSLTTVAQPMGEMGRCAFELLLSALNGKARETRHIVLPHRLIERQSLGPAPRR